MKKIEMLSEVKHNGKWAVTYRTDDESIIYPRLALAVVAKKINACRYISRIQRRNNYDGTQDVVIYYDSGLRVTFTVATNL